MRTLKAEPIQGHLREIKEKQVGPVSMMPPLKILYTRRVIYLMKMRTCIKAQGEETIYLELLTRKNSFIKVYRKKWQDNQSIALVMILRVWMKSMMMGLDITPMKIFMLTTIMEMGSDMDQCIQISNNISTMVLLTVIWTVVPITIVHAPTILIRAEISNSPEWVDPPTKKWCLVACQWWWWLHKTRITNLVQVTILGVPMVRDMQLGIAMLLLISQGNSQMKLRTPVCW